MACALTSHSLRESLCRFPYAVCEKSDGERFLLLITAATDDSPRAVLADRSFSLFELSGAISMGGGRAPSTVGAVMAQLVSPAGDTLVDGELVSRPALPPGKAIAGEVPTPVFLVFDAVQVNGTRTADRRLPDRLSAVGTGVRERLRRDDTKRAHAGLPLLPLLVLGKTFCKAPDLHRVLAHVASWPAARAPASPGDVTAAALKLGHGEGGGGAAGGRAAAAAASAAAAGVTEHAGIGRAEVSVYCEGQRVNGNDGLVFTPEAPSYVDLLSMPDKAAPGGAPVQPLLKWKPLLENTVDFLVRLVDAEAAAGGSGAGCTATLFSSAGGRTVEQAATSLTPEQGKALVSVMRAHGKKDLVVECMVDEAAAKGVVRSLAGDHTAAALPADKVTSAALKLAYRRGLFYQRWVIIRLRPDKARANSVLTAVSTMEALADSVTPADVAAAIRQAMRAPQPGAARTA
ncbi:hypothetical protein FNF31_06821 [Cafeteria roenbergensis]|nr:hypothetical protein FNF31_06821 [Cafeteria roenbergensis]